MYFDLIYNPGVIMRFTASIILIATLVASPLSACASDDYIENINDMESYTINLSVNGQTVSATMASNSATAELRKLLEKGDVRLSMHDYGGFEKVGALPQSFTRNDHQITTTPGDIMLYQGDQMVIFYGNNSWAYTPFGKIDNLTASQIKSFLGTGNVDVVLSLAGASGIDDITSTDDSDKKEYYDLNGRKVHDATKGIVIERVNGKSTKKIKR